MKVLSIATLTVVSLLFVGCDSDGTAPVNEAIHIPALVAFSGDNGAEGPVYLAALETAVEDANEELGDEGMEVQLHYGDTQSDPGAAAILMNTYLLQDRRIVVGPYTSAEVAGIQEMVGESGSLIISPSSTSLTLAQAQDHVFRLAPNDSYMVADLVDLMWERGHRYLVLVYRDDPWGLSVATEMQTQFTAKGGTVLSAYDYGSFRTSVISRVLKDMVEDIGGEAGIQSPSDVAIHLTSLDEGSLVFEVAADSVPELADYGWYGSDGFVQDQYVVNTEELAAFAIQANYTAPIFRAEAAEAHADIVTRIEVKAGVTAGAYALLTYDAMRIAARTLAQAGTDVSYAGLEAALGEVLESYQGLSGTIELDASGDRVGGSYDFFTIQQVGSSYQWVLVNEG